MADVIATEIHPFQPFVNENTRLLIMGTFPPPKNRWAMDFFYPNPTNDFWYMMGLIFFGDRKALLLPESRYFDLEKIKAMLTERGIGMSDTGYEIRRLTGNASDKFLEIVRPIALDELLSRFPAIATLCTTGEKAAAVLAEITRTEAPKMGQSVTTDSGLTIWRMPSTSRAYPLALDKKADYYRKMFQEAGIITPTT